MIPLYGTITSKGQVTIPKKLRDRVGLKAGTKLVFIPEGKGFRTQPAARRLKIFDYIGSLKHLDDGRPWSEIRDQAHRAAAAYAIKRAHRR